jgi:hypothetical protein
MLHALIIADASAEALAQTLSDLVSGAVEGVVRRATVVAPLGAEEALFEVADDAGANFKRADGGFGARAAAIADKGEWLMVLSAGVRLPHGWHAAAADHLRRYPDQAAAVEGDRAGLLGRRALLALIAPRAEFNKAGGFSPGDADLRPLLRRLGRVRRL